MQLGVRIPDLQDELGESLGRSLLSNLDYKQCYTETMPYVPAPGSQWLIF